MHEQLMAVDKPRRNRSIQVICPILFRKTSINFPGPTRDNTPITAQDYKSRYPYLEVRSLGWVITKPRWVQRLRPEETLLTHGNSKNWVLFQWRNRRVWYPVNGDIVCYMPLGVDVRVLDIRNGNINRVSNNLFAHLQCEYMHAIVSQPTIGYDCIITPYAFQWYQVALNLSINISYPRPRWTWTICARQT